MAKVIATCPNCGDVNLTQNDICVTLNPAAGWATFSFTCTSCHTDVHHPAEEDQVQQLSFIGCKIDRIPAEYSEPKPLEPFPPNYLESFLEWLGETDVTEEIADGG